MSGRAATVFPPGSTDECPEVDLPGSTLATAGAASAEATFAKPLSLLIDRRLLPPERKEVSLHERR